MGMRPGRGGRQSFRPEMLPRLVGRTPPWREPALPTAPCEAAFCPFFVCLCVCLCTQSPRSLAYGDSRVGRLVSHGMCFPWFFRGVSCVLCHGRCRSMSCLSTVCARVCV